jgi:ABC-type glutathione transport system ATPase component
LDYIVGIKGSKLSGGQKQRVAIARAILLKPKLLILDEATSALDNKSEKEVQKALDIVSQGVTTLVIAHRLQTIINSNKIVCLDQGHIVEEGKHDELLAKNGFYANLIHQRQESEKEKKKKVTEDEEEEEDYENDEFYQSESDNLNDKNQSNKVNSQYLGDDKNGKHENYEIHANSIVLQDKKLTEKVVIEPTGKKTTEPNVRKNTEPQRKLSVHSVERKNSEGGSARRKKNLESDSQSNLTQSKPTKEEIERDKKIFKSARSRLIQILKEEKKFAIGGMIAAACNGAVWPVYGVLLADAMGALSGTDVRTEGRNVALMFLALAILAGLVLWMQQ